MKYTAVRIPNDNKRATNKRCVVYLRGTWSKAEIKSYLNVSSGGPLPKFVKVKVDKNFNGRRALMHIVGYDVINVVANLKGRVTTVVFKKRDEQ